jgi:hypothetical protein
LDLGDNLSCGVIPTHPLSNVLFYDYVFRLVNPWAKFTHMFIMIFVISSRRAEEFSEEETEDLRVSYIDGHICMDVTNDGFEIIQPE